MATAGSRETGLRRPNRPLIRDASFEDYPGIARLHQRNGLSIRGREAWETLWTGNPAFHRRPACPIGWVLETATGEIVGSISAIPDSYHFRGREFASVSVCAWVADPDYRRFSLSLLQALVRHAPADLLISTTANAAAEAGLQLFQFSRALTGEWNRVSFWVTDPLSFARAVLQARRVPVPLSLLAQPLLAAGMFCRDGIYRRTRSGSAELSAGGAFDERFDVFWEELKRARPGVLLAERTARCLAWRFGNRADVHVVTGGSGGRVTSCAIFDRQDQPALGLKRVRFVDFQALPGFEQQLAPSIEWMLAECRRKRLHVLEIPGDWHRSSLLPPVTAPYARQLPSWSWYFRCMSSASLPLPDEAIWFSTLYDGDSSLG